MRKILIIEDQAPMAKILSDILKKENFETFTAINGQAGIDKAVEIRPDMVITDIMMPVKTGWEVLKELRAMPAFEKTPIFIITAKGGASDSKTAADGGASGFIQKPFSPSQIVEEIKKILGE
ncbi:MAG TPA: response regulator [Leptospiraceae bacterium]|nr:response regulator [Leptospiraceae bacterium]HMY65831.1 response regulator [Leptospiraceae bacterium]HMZ57503.1 response regulator [Leptospiraceae bacterium]HNF14262.1 response regulator [Leptospiraceae bacterium]HNF26221.1 response regulator [Leptospiraceae bacterium]